MRALNEAFCFGRLIWESDDYEEHLSSSVWLVMIIIKAFFLIKKIPLLNSVDYEFQVFAWNACPPSLADRKVSSAEWTDCTDRGSAACEQLMFKYITLILFKHCQL